MTFTSAAPDPAFIASSTASSHVEMALKWLQCPNIVVQMWHMFLHELSPFGEPQLRQTAMSLSREAGNPEHGVLARLS